MSMKLQLLLPEVSYSWMIFGKQNHLNIKKYFLFLEEKYYPQFIKAGLLYNQYNKGYDQRW